MFDDLDEPEKTLAQKLFEMDQSDEARSGEAGIPNMLWFDKDENKMLGKGLSDAEKEQMIADSKSSMDNADQENAKRAKSLTLALSEYFQAKVGASSEES